MISRHLHGAVFLGVLAATTANAAVEVSSKPTANMSCSGGVCTPTAKKAVLNVDDLAQMLSSGDTMVKSTSQNPDIEVDAAFSWTSGNRLTLDAYHSLALNNPVEVAGTGALTITTNDGGSGGDFRFFKKGHVEFWDLNSSLVINGHGYELVKTIKQLAGDIRRDGNGYYALAKDINAKGRTYEASPITHGFGGVFEGLGNSISNLSISDSRSGDNVGFFSQVITAFAMVRDIGLKAVNINGGTNTGALVGNFSGGKILNSYATGQVASFGQGSVGGLIGLSSFSNVETSYAAVAVSKSGDGGEAGGLVGRLYGDCSRGCFGVVENSYATGTVTGGDNSKVGGLVGYSLSGALVNSYATGTVSGGVSSFAGGLMGSNTDDTSGQTAPIITASYSTGAVSGGSGATIGGLIGNDVADAQNTNDYWDMDTSGVSDPSKGAGNVANDPGITGLSDAQLKSALPSGFDKKIWNERAQRDTGYPYLIDNPPPK